jgi:hypothetical protein
LEEGEDLVLEGRRQRDDAPEDREEVLVMFAHEFRRDPRAVRRHVVNHEVLVAVPTIDHSRSLEDSLDHVASSSSRLSLGQILTIKLAMHRGAVAAHIAT